MQSQSSSYLDPFPSVTATGSNHSLILGTGSEVGLGVGIGSSYSSTSSNFSSLSSTTTGLSSTTTTSTSNTGVSSSDDSFLSNLLTQFSVSNSSSFGHHQSLAGPVDIYPHLDVNFGTHSFYNDNINSISSSHALAPTSFSSLGTPLDHQMSLMGSIDMNSSSSTIKSNVANGMIAINISCEFNFSPSISNINSKVKTLVIKTNYFDPIRESLDQPLKLVSRVANIWSVTIHFPILMGKLKYTYSMYDSNGNEWVDATQHRIVVEERETNIREITREDRVSEMTLLQPVAFEIGAISQAS
jgi:hypothetical protein